MRAPRARCDRGVDRYSKRAALTPNPYPAALSATMSLSGLILYQRDDCHLCDLALDVLASARAPEFDSVFVDGDDALEGRYGIRVPVLRDASSGVELDWPFDAAAVRRLLAR